MKFIKFNQYFLILLVYARCITLERLELWEELLALSEDPWIVGEDFNVLLNEEEKLGGLDFTQHEGIEFAQCINTCGLSEIKF